jgi:hypothetical protein
MNEESEVIIIIIFATPPQLEFQTMQDPSLIKTRKKAVLLSLLTKQARTSWRAESLVIGLAANENGC